jgi:hypothetical protein
VELFLFVLKIFFGVMVLTMIMEMRMKWGNTEIGALGVMLLKWDHSQNDGQLLVYKMAPFACPSVILMKKGQFWESMLLLY